MDITIGFDKIKVKHCYTDSPYGKAEFGQLYGWVDDCLHGELGKKGSLSKVHPQGSLSRIHQKLPDGGYLDVMYGYAGGKQSAWFQFNPTKLSGNDLATLGGHMSILLDQAFLTLWKSGVVSYAEIAIDVRGALFDDYMYIDTSLRSANKGYEEVGTMYLGSKSSNRSFCCYDKSKQQSHEGIYAVDTLRIEAKLKEGKAFRLEDVYSLTSPFETLLIVDRLALKKCSHQLVQQFKSRANVPGASPQVAYLHTPPKQRGSLQKALRELQPTWWEAEKIWAGFPASLGWIKELAACMY
jgi:hypothetical protein